MFSQTLTKRDKGDFVRKMTSGHRIASSATSESRGENDFGFVCGTLRLPANFPRALQGFLHFRQIQSSSYQIAIHLSRPVVLMLFLKGVGWRGIR